jgi:catechol 2,3-dioxygenase-like lactoylglutathione lyase family enzyme
MSEPRRRVDHLVHAVHDLDAAGDFYRRLGFQVGARNRHPWGTENRIVQLGSSFLEIITVGDRPGDIPPHAPHRFSFGAFVQDYLRRREGVAMLVLDSADAPADAREFANAGIGAFETFFFERAGRRPDGSTTEVAFTLAFALDPGLPDAAFFVCQQHFPENFWNPAFQEHANGATNVSVVTIASPEPEARSGFLSTFAGSPATRTVGGYTCPLRNDGRVDLVENADGGGIVAFSVAVPDPAGLALALSAAAIPHDISDAGVTVRAPDAHGVDIVFSRAEA